LGKRSNFERIAADFYVTQWDAVVPLIPHLSGINAFAEPCCGDGALVRHLEAIGLRCVYFGDIRFGKDALAFDSYGEVDAIITNPPYTRELMHRLIDHFQKIAPTWLLLEFDWIATQQAKPFMRTCSDVVVIGRLRWFPETKNKGKESYAWCRFDGIERSGTLLHHCNNGGKP